MKYYPSRAAALTLAVVITLSGCASMPNVEAVDQAAADATLIGAPFEFKFHREALDADESNSPKSALTLEAATRFALRHDPGIQAAIARVRQSQAEARQTRLLPNPVLSLAFRFPEGGGSADIEASIAADLLSLLRKPGQISAADQRLRKSTADALTVVLDVLNEVQQQYVKIQAISARVAIDELRRESLRDLTRVSEARLNAGEAVRLDVLTVQSEVATLEAQMIRRRSEERQARLRLTRLIAAPTAAATWRLDAWKPPADISDIESQWIKTALEKRPELRSIVWELAALGQDFRVARFSTIFGNGELGIDAERDGGDWAIGPGGTLPIPLFDTGHEQRAMIAARVVEQQHLLTQIERQVVEEVRVTLEQLRFAKTALSAIEQRVIPLQNERLTQARNAYRSGVTDILNVRLAEQDLQEALSQQVDLQELLSQAMHQLARAVGGPAHVNLIAPASQPATTKSENESHE